MKTLKITLAGLRPCYLTEMKVKCIFLTKILLLNEIYKAIYFYALILFPKTFQKNYITFRYFLT